MDKKINNTVHLRFIIIIVIIIIMFWKRLIYGCRRISEILYYIAIDRIITHGIKIKNRGSKIAMIFFSVYVRQ